MTIEQRLGRLEARKGGADMAEQQRKEELIRASEAFAARLAKIEAAVRASGDFNHSERESRASNLVRACLRGDGEAVASILGRHRSD